MGFKPQKQTPKPEMLLIASSALTDIDGMAQHVAEADAVVLRIPKPVSEAKALEKIPQAISDIPCGGWLKGGVEGTIPEMPKLNCDFIIFPAANTPLALFQGGEASRVLEVDLSLSEGIRRAINDLPVDAVLVAVEAEARHPLTWHHLMLLQRTAGLLTKPLLASVPPDVSRDELQSLWEAGVKGIVVEASSRQAVDRVRELRQIIDKLTPPSSRKQKKVAVVVPYISSAAPAVEEEEEE